MSIPVHHNRMHDFILTELELGTRVALWQDAEDCGFGALDGLIAEYWFRKLPPKRRMTAEDYR